MVETNHHFESENESTKPSRLLDRRPTPEGVVSKQSQAYVMAGLAVLILFAVLFSKSRQRTVMPAAQSSSTYAAPSEINERKIQDLKEELNKAQRSSEQEAHPASGPNASAIPDVGGAPPMPQMPAPEVQRDPIADAEKQIAFKSRFASNLISSEPPQTPPQSGPPSPVPQSSALRTVASADSFNPLVQKALQLGVTGDKPVTPEKHPAEVNVNAASGQPYVLFEGTTIDTTLLNRLNGDFAGPVKVMVTNPVYSHDRQHVLVPEGTFLLGDAQKVDHFGQKRLAVSFHRMIMPDGYSVDLDKFHGLSQIGETGLTDQINNHYLEIFGVSIAVGLITGAADATTNTSAVNLSNSDAIKESAVASIAQSASHVLDRFLNILPTITIREGLRIKIYLTEDLLLPAYENHAVPPGI
jgi:type IV secretory pathway VirB10-like protein